MSEHRHLMKSRAIATHYAGARFRSRLEARWAAFFDLCGWRWEYEPPEEDGWIPDFALIGAKDVVKVEVKPINWVGNRKDMDKQTKAYPDLEKVKKYCEALNQNHDYERGWIEEDILILGSYPHHLDWMDGYHQPTLGFLLQDGCPAVITKIHIRDQDRFDFCSADMSYHMRMSGFYNGHFQEAESDDVDALWRQAGAKVQWMRRKMPPGKEYPGG